MTDGQLLEQFFKHNRPGAFEELVRRHGPMVFGVCQCILMNHPLALSFTKIDDAGLASLKGMTNLQQLDLSNTSITDAGLQHLKGLSRLQRIDLRGTQVTEAGSAELMQTIPDLKLEK